MLILCRSNLGLCAKVDTDALTEHILAVEFTANVDGGFDRVERCDDAAEGFQRGERVGCGMAVECLLYACEVCGGEDGDIVEVGDDQGVGRRSGFG